MCPQWTPASHLSKCESPTSSCTDFGDSPLYLHLYPMAFSQPTTIICQPHLLLHEVLYAVLKLTTWAAVVGGAWVRIYGIQGIASTRLSVDKFRVCIRISFFSFSFFPFLSFLFLLWIKLCFSLLIPCSVI
ncbi:hypothetical protein GGR56DRAFT_631213 [Xylariaceae sp. FL0804]|nr:hypothetical protein GGR56DRAFT_631213 [Xylariaceae sp. FL0804]